MAVRELNLEEEKEEIDLSSTSSSSDTDPDTEVDDTVDMTDGSELREIPEAAGRKDKVWDNDELQVIKPPITAFVPQHVLTLMRSIEAKMSPSRLEFGAFLKGELRDGCLWIEKDFMVVKQKVTGVTIDFLEDPADGFNGVIHRHPGGCKRFSGTDDSSINQNYDFSLLYVDNAISYGVINLNLLDGTRLQVELKVNIMYPITDDVSEMLENITEEEIETVPPRKMLGEGTGHLPGLLRDNPRWPTNLGNETDDPDDPDDTVYDLGDGYTYDGTYCYDRDNEVVDEEDLPDDQKVALINVMCVDGSI